MDKIQLEKSEQAPTTATSLIQAKPGGGGGDLAGAAMAPIQAKPAGGGGGGGGGDGAWDADAGLMSAFGVGGPVQAKAAAPSEPRSTSSISEALSGAGGTPGKQASAGAVQHKEGGGAAAGGPMGGDAIHQTAAQGVAGGGGQLPHIDQIQGSFGDHDVSGVNAHTGGAAAHAANAMGAEAYATGNDVAFGSSAPSLHTAAHEAAHVVQQRGGNVNLQGGVGQVGDDHEQHADAVADRVVQGKSAEDLLSQKAPAGGSTGGGGVQRKALQFDIKADLRKAMEGWGTDEAAIFARLQRAGIPELQAVVADAKLLAELKDELSRTEMERVLDLINAPLPAKLELAIDGWTNDDTYIRRSLDRATPVELQAAGANTALVNKLVGTLGSTFLKTVLDRMKVPLARKLEYALSGWGADEQYVYSAITQAAVPDVVALLANASLMAKLDGEGWPSLRGRLARRIFPGGSADDAFKALVSTNDAQLDTRLEEYGSIQEQRTLLDGVITLGIDAVRVQRAFHAYWHVEVTSAAAAAATTNGGDNGAPSPAVAARNWPIPTLQAIHRQMKLLPDQDSRSGVWNKLSLTNSPSLINRAAYSGGNFLVGSNASPAGAPSGGYSVRLTANAAVGATTLQVSEGPRFKVGDTLALDRAGPNRDVSAVTAIAGNAYTIGTALTHAHARGDLLEPDDGSGVRAINWLDATVRHEIAHSLDGGGCDTSGFYAKGEWALGAGDAGFETWVAAMGGEAAWTPNDGSKISDPDRAKIKTAIVDAVTNRKGSLFATFGAQPTHPIMVNQHKAVPVMTAAETCLLLGDNFYNAPTTMYAANGKRFTISWWYRRFQHHNEAVVSQRVANYGLYAPTEFFAEAYTVFYEEAGKPGITDADYGRLIRNSDWRSWLRDHVHNRGLAPAGTGAAKAPAGTPPGGPEPGAHPGAGTRGRSAGNPGM